MEIIANGYRATKAFVSSIIEWRSAATAPYFMIINSAFWWSVFYLDREAQLRLLISLAAGVFGWDILLSPTHERSILFHILTWPIRNTLRTVSVAMALYSAQSLYQSELEKACWSAYTTVALLVLNPVLQYQRIPQQINGYLYSVCVTVKDVTNRVVISPLCALYRILEYIVLLRWLPVLVEKLKTIWLRIKTAISNFWCAVLAKLRDAQDTVLNIITSTLLNIKNFTLRIVYGIKNTIYGFFTTIRNCIIGILTFCKNTTVNCIIIVKNGIVSCVLAVTNGIISIITAFKGGIRSGFVALKNAIISGILALKDAVITGIIRTKDAVYFTAVTTTNYIHRGIIAFQNSILNFYHALLKWTETKILKPIRNAYRVTVEFLRYWLCAHWWPSLKAWLILHVGRQLQRLFNYFCFGLVYVFCGYWIEPVGAFLSHHLERFYAYFKRTVLVPLKIWVKRRLNDALICIRQMLHNLAIAMRDSVLWPFCLLLVAIMKRVFVYFHRIVLQPIINALYEKYKIVEDYMLIHFLGPACQVFVDHIPERSPFCDDTDTELAELLPPGFDDDEESDTEGTSDKPSLPSRSLSPLTEDEHDFVRGLKFPAVNTSDSSEDEFSLRPKSKSKTQKQIKKKPKTYPKDPAPSMPSGGGELDSGTHDDAANNKDKQRKQSSSAASSHSESAASSSAQYAPDVADLRELNVLDSESEISRDTETIQKVEKPEERTKPVSTAEIKKSVEQNIEQSGTNVTVTAAGLDGDFEVLDQ